MKTTRLIHVVIAAIACACSSVSATSQTIVVPGGFASQEGNSNSILPFNISPIFSSIRYQQVYNASEFSALTTPSFITDIAFRPDGEFGNAFNKTLNSVQIDLSTTSAAAGTLSTTFAGNIGADDTIVHSGPLTLQSLFNGPANGPKDFDIVIHLDTPFKYDPSQGNLLLDIRSFDAVSTSSFDAVSGNSVTSRVFTGLLGSVNDPVGKSDPAGVGNIGLVTQFTVQAVPEPGGLTLLFGLTGSTALFTLLRRRRAA